MPHDIPVRPPSYYTQAHAKTQPHPGRIECLGHVAYLPLPHMGTKPRFCRSECKHRACRIRRFWWRYHYDGDFRLTFDRAAFANYYYSDKCISLSENYVQYENRFPLPASLTAEEIIHFDIENPKPYTS